MILETFIQLLEMNIFNVDMEEIIKMKRMVSLIILILRRNFDGRINGLF